MRQRLTICFGRPSWTPIREIRAACESLPVQSKKPEDFVASLLFPILRWSIAEPKGKLYKPSAADGALELVDQKFDEHVALQRENFLVNGKHEEAKTHGKLRTKYDRLVLPLHHLDAVCALWLQESAANGAGFDIEGQACACLFFVGFMDR